MENKYKLAPHKPTENMCHDALETVDGNTVPAEVYYKMTAECPTVEVVDAEQIVNDFCKAYLKSKGMCYPSFTDYLTQNGYKIIKETK